MTLAELLNEINTKLASGSSIDATELRGVLSGITQSVFDEITAAVQVLSGTNPTWDCTKDVARITLTGNTTINLSNYSLAVGRLHVKQDGTGNRTLAIEAGGTMGTLQINPEPNSLTLCSFSNDGETTLFQNNFGTVGTGTSTGATFTNPPAPTNGVVDNDANTFTFTPATGYTSSQHEYSLDAGQTWTTLGATPSFAVGDVNKEVGVVQVRVKAGTGRNSGAVLSNNVAFTSGVATGITFGTLTNITASNNNETLTKSGGANFNFGDNNAFSSSPIPLGSYIQCILGTPADGYGVDFGLVAKLSGYADTEIRFVRIESANKNDGYGEVSYWSGTTIVPRQFWHAGATIRVEHRSNGSMFFKVKEAGESTWTEWAMGISNATSPWFVFIRLNSLGNSINSIQKGTIAL